mgnify:CR=1 FL=1
MSARAAAAAALLAACSPTPGPEIEPSPQASVLPVPPSAPIASVSAPQPPPASSDPPDASAGVAPPEVPPPGFTGIPDKRATGFPGVTFANVRAFAFDLGVSGRPECYTPLDPDGTLCRTVRRPGVELSGEQAKQLVKLLAQPSTYGGGSACFLPHHGFVFYDANETPVAVLSVCFLCDMARSSPAIPQSKGGGEGTGFGITEKGRDALRGLCNELGLPKCDAKSPDEFGRGR